MHFLLFKILVLIPILTLLGILTYKKINESFDGMPTSETEPMTTSASLSQPQTTTPPELISTQLTTGIANILGISVRRIANLNYTGDINTQTLAVSFSILDPNIIEASRNELSATVAATTANTLFTQRKFIVAINGINIMLNKINTNNTSNSINASNASNAGNAINDGIIGSSSSNIGNVGNVDKANYFNNNGLLDTIKYTKQIYDTVPVDAAATRFFTLQPDGNFNLIPVIN